MTVDDNMKHRVGRYVRQAGDYRAFIPEALPPEPPVEMDDMMWTLLSQADRALGRLDGSTEILPNPDLFVFMYVRKEAVLSSQIEGTQASLIDLLEFEAEATESGKPRDVEEVANYVAAIKHGLARLETLPVSLRLIREIHGKLLEGARGGKRDPGEFRRSQNWIRPAGCTLKNARYVPPPLHEMMDALSNLEKFIHDDTPMPTLIKVGLLHSQFETIHPFLDGNGRVGRLLITFFLCERGALKHPLLYLSYYFKQNRSEYYDRLQAVRDRGDWDGWLKFFLRGVYEVSQEATKTAREIIQQREHHRSLISGNLAGGAGNALDLLEALYQRPIVSVQFVSEVTGLAYSNANNLVGKFEEMGLLKETTGKRKHRRFSYEPYLALFEDEPSDEIEE